MIQNDITIYNSPKQVIDHFSQSLPPFPTSFSIGYKTKCGNLTFRIKIVDRVLKQGFLLTEAQMAAVPGSTLSGRITPLFNAPFANIAHFKKELSVCFDREFRDKSWKTALNNFVIKQNCISRNDPISYGCILEIYTYNYSRDENVPLPPEDEIAGYMEVSTGALVYFDRKQSEV